MMPAGSWVLGMSDILAIGEVLVALFLENSFCDLRNWKLVFRSRRAAARGGVCFFRGSVLC